MNRVKTVMMRDIEELWKGIPFKVILMLFFLILAGLIILLTINLNDLYNEIQTLEQNIMESIIKDVTNQYIIPIPVYFLTMMPFIIFVWIFLDVGKEKASGNLETLLATPLKPIDIVLGKSLAIFIPCLIISVISSIILILAMNLGISIMLAQPVFIISLPSIVSSFVLNPLLFFAFILLTTILSLVKNPEVAIIPSFPLGFGLIIGVSIGLGLQAINLGSWTFTFYNLCLTLLLWLINVILFPSLKKETIILSAKIG